MYFILHWQMHVYIHFNCIINYFIMLLYIFKCSLMASNKHVWPVKLANVKKWILDAFECIYVQFSSCVSTSVHAFKNSFYSDSDSFELNFRIWGFNMLLYFIISSGLCHVVCKRVGLATQCPADCSWLSRRWISSAALCPCLWWSPRVGLLAPRLA